MIETTPILDNAYVRLQMAALHAATSLHNERRDPTARQAVAGNYKKAPFRWNGLLLMLENVLHSVRTGTSPDGKTWANRLNAHYGEIAGTVGNDGDPIDIFVGLFPELTHLWVINQSHADGSFDEHKVMVGFATEEQARDAYLLSFDRGWTGLQSMAPASLTQFKWWLKHGDKSRPFSLDQLPFDGQPAMSKTLWNAAAEPTTLPMNKLVYGLRSQDAAGLLLDAVTMADIMGDPDVTASPLLDALVVEVARMQAKMTLLQRVMNGAASLQVPAFQISDPVKSRGVMQVAVLFELSDGQTVTVWFHNPDTTPAKLTPMDELVSWKWMLNKKDITIVVAPERGRDLQIREVARRIMKLAERNAEAFAKANAKLVAKIEMGFRIDGEISGLEKRLVQVTHEVEVARQNRIDAGAAATGDAEPTAEEIAAAAAAETPAEIAPEPVAEEAPEYSIAREIRNIKAVVASSKPASLTLGFTMNAPRPLVGHETAEGEFLTGRFYAAIDITDSYAQRYVEENIKLDARAVFMADESIIDAMAFHTIPEEYRAAYLAMPEQQRKPLLLQQRRNLKDKTYGELEALSYLPMPEGAPATWQSKYLVQSFDDKWRVTGHNFNPISPSYATKEEAEAAAEAFFGGADFPLPPEYDKPAEIEPIRTLLTEDEQAALRDREAAARVTLEGMSDERIGIVGAHPALLTVVGMGAGREVAIDKILENHPDDFEKAIAAVVAAPLAFHEMSFDQAKARADELWAASSASEATMGAFPKGAMGLTPDEVRATDEFKAAKKISDKTFSDLRSFNAQYTKKFKSEIAAAREAERAAKLAAQQAAEPAAEEPAAEASLDDNLVAVVDAAYVFAKATTAFKLEVSGSVEDEHYSQFATAKAMDEAAKSMGYAIAWDVGMAVLDAADDAERDVEEADRAALLDDAEILDAAEKFRTIIGKIKSGSTVIGRAMIGGDGKAMVYVGKTGTERAKYVSKVDGEARPFMWSDDDAAEMITALITAFEPATDYAAEWTRMPDAMRGGKVYNAGYHEADSTTLTAQGENFVKRAWADIGEIAQKKIIAGWNGKLAPVAEEPAPVVEEPAAEVAAEPVADERNKPQWEDDVINIVAEELGVDHGDADAVVAAQEFVMTQQWDAGNDAATAAAAVVAAGSKTADAKPKRVTKKEAESVYDALSYTVNDLAGHTPYEFFRADVPGRLEEKIVAVRSVMDRGWPDGMASPSALIERAEATIERWRGEQDAGLTEQTLGRGDARTYLRNAEISDEDAEVIVSTPTSVNMSGGIEVPQYTVAYLEDMIAQTRARNAGAEIEQPENRETVTPLNQEIAAETATDANLIVEGAREEPVINASEAADREFLNGLIDGSGDLLSPDTFPALEPMFARYAEGTDMFALLEKAAIAFGDAAEEFSKKMAVL